MENSGKEGLLVMRFRKLVALFAAALMLSIGAVTQASAEDFDVTAITCDDVLAVSDEEAAYVMLITYGYLAGQNGEDEQSPARIESTIKSALAKCDANPELSVVSAMAS